MSMDDVVIKVNEAVEAAEMARIEAVAALRAQGRSWAEIGKVLGLSGATARHRFLVQAKMEDPAGALGQGEQARRRKCPTCGRFWDNG